jgi:pimeloyl-ACP methyl ester carboxylesterase
MGNQKVLTAYASSLNVDVFAFEYSGYLGTSLSDGTRPQPSERFCYENARKSYDWLVRSQKVPTESVVVYGRSLGSGVAVDFAAKHLEIGGCILQSPILSAARVVLPTSVPGLDIFRNDKKIANVRAPTFVIHGTDDRVVPFQHGVELKSMLTCPFQRKWWVQGGGHNNLEESFGRELVYQLDEFLVSIQEHKPEPYGDPLAVRKDTTLSNLWSSSSMC